MINTLVSFIRGKKTGIGSLVLTVVCSLFFMGKTHAADTYVIDTKGAHAFVQFRVKHLGYSWLYGRFNKFDGEFTYDAKNDAKNTVSVTVNMSSLDSNHAERDKHLRGGKYLNASKFKTAKFVSTSYKTTGKDKAKLTGDLTLMGVTKSITLDVDVIGGGDDPWGGYRQGFEGTTTISAADFGMKGAKSVGEIELTWSVEGIRK